MEKNPKNITIIAVVALFAVAAFFSVYKLSESPPVWYDEGWYFQSANNLASTGEYGIQFSPGAITHVSMLQTVSYPLIYPMALWLKAFGASVLTGRSLMVVFILLLLAVAYMLSKRLSGSAIAVGTLALLATFPPLYGNGKSILGETPGLLYLLVFLLLFNFARSVKSKKALWLILSGFFAGLCLVTKPFFFLLVPAIVIGLIIEWRRGTITPRETVIFVAACIVPFLIWLGVQLGPGDSISSLISYYANPYSYQAVASGHSLFATVWLNVQSLFKNMNTLYTLFMMLVWLGSLFVRKYSKTTISVEEIIAFCFAILVCLAFLRIGTILRYLFAAQIIALVFLPNTLSIVIRSLSPRVPGLVTASIVAILSLYGLYQVTFDSYVAEAYTSHRSEFWQGYFADITSSTSVFFYDTPEVVSFIGHRNYYQLLLSDRANPLGKKGLKVIESGGVDMVIVEKSKYTPLKESLFKNYALEQIVYRYSILKRGL